MLKNNRGNTIVKLLVVVVIVGAFVFAVLKFKDKLNFGFGMGGGKGGSENGTATASVDTQDELEKKVEAHVDTGTYTITINLNKVTSDDGLVIEDNGDENRAEYKRRLGEYVDERANDSTKFILLDQHAIEATYEWVKGVFDERGIKMEEKVADSGS